MPTSETVAVPKFYFKLTIQGLFITFMHLICVQVLLTRTLNF